MPTNLSDIKARAARKAAAVADDQKQAPGSVPKKHFN
jgi:hypothetical protein